VSTLLDELVHAVPERGAALLVRGEAGIGKSTLLAAACRRAENAGMRVLRTAGVQSKAQLPFAGLHQLVLPVLGQADRLPTPQRDARPPTRVARAPNVPQPYPTPRGHKRRCSL
jgi:predicted ATPase